MKPFDRITNPRDIRRKLHMNQQEFWSRIGVTQSGGSRYESGRTMPKPVRELLRLVHIEGIELSKARGEASGETERDRIVARTVDRVRDRFGAKGIIPASLTTTQHTEPKR